MATLHKQGTEVARLHKLLTTSSGPLDAYLSFRSNGKVLCKFGSGRWRISMRHGSTRLDNDARALWLDTYAKQGWHNITRANAPQGGIDTADDNGGHYE